ncbi:MAG: hypothetical protein AAFQ17_07460 [Pseudomonadota bacterium]
MVLGAFLYLKLTTDPFVVGAGLVSMVLIFGFEVSFIHSKQDHPADGDA